MLLSCTLFQAAIRLVGEDGQPGQVEAARPDVDRRAREDPRGHREGRGHGAGRDAAGRVRKEGVVALEGRTLLEFLEEEESTADGSISLEPERPTNI